ncbi:hypothetical protein KL86CLO1_13180 [uncultured Eubacteriales bacterium]|uniref:Uncharacterized protein n=1 Tax=uncultured Eubacteriales bacterium TaxID=172733 RepID=A0A212KHJ1_9FIRM|nr:hypothetical protein KL86CLO1_13180 [uncultured Eubacteriales bacterium]
MDSHAKIMRWGAGFPYGEPFPMRSSRLPPEGKPQVSPRLPGTGLKGGALDLSEHSMRIPFFLTPGKERYICGNICPE